MTIHSGPVGRQCSWGDPKRMCGRCGTALPGDQPDPATTSSEEQVGRGELSLCSVLHGAKRVTRKQVTEGHVKAMRNETEVSHAGESLLILPHAAPEKRQGLSQWSRLLTLQRGRQSHALICHTLSEWERSGRRNKVFTPESCHTLAAVKVQL